MKLVSVREFRSNTATIRKELEVEREIVLTSNGKPFALLTPLEPATVEDEVLAIRRARARLAVDRIRAHARQTGLDKMPLKDINAEIAAARREMHANR